MGQEIAENLYAQRNRLERETRKLDDVSSSKRRAVSLVIVTTILLGISIINMASASFYTMSMKGYGKLLSHIGFIFFAIILGVVTTKINYKFYNRNRICLVLGVLSLGMFAFLFVGHKIIPGVVPRINGAIGWIRIGGLSIQPAEVIKIPYIIILAHLFEKCEEKKIRGFKIISMLMPVVCLFTLGLMAQQDMGTALHYIAIFVFMLFMSKFEMKWIIRFAVMIGALLSGAFYYIYSKDELNSTSYKVKRIASFLDGIIKNEYDNQFGYQVGQSLNAFGNGGILGKGYANGVQKYNYLPEIKTDFVMACFGEEFGFLGMTALLIFFFLIFTLIKSVAMSSKDYFGKYLAIGIGGYLIIQVLINIYVALGMLPVFGIPMPLFSYGGTSLVTVLVALGIVMNINRENR